MNRHCLESSSPPARTPGAILLETDRLFIRRPLSSGGPAFASAINFPEVVRNLSDKVPYPYTLDDAEILSKELFQRPRTIDREVTIQQRASSS